MAKLTPIDRLSAGFGGQRPHVDSFEAMLIDTYEKKIKNEVAR